MQQGFQLTYSINARIRFTLKELGILVRSAGVHYDSYCKRTICPGGCIWSTLCRIAIDIDLSPIQLLENLSNGDWLSKDEAIVSDFSAEDVDILLKVLEKKHPFDDKFDTIIEHQALVGRIQKIFASMAEEWKDLHMPKMLYRFNDFFRLPDGITDNVRLIHKDRIGFTAKIVTKEQRFDFPFPSEALTAMINEHPDQLNEEDYE
jgi:hypothetical protein